MTRDVNFYEQLREQSVFVRLSDVVDLDLNRTDPICQRGPTDFHSRNAIEGTGIYITSKRYESP